MARLVLVSLLLLTVCFPGAAGAEENPAEFDGFFVGFSLGAGAGQFRADGESTTREVGLGANMRLAYRLSVPWILSLEISGWSADIDRLSLAQLTIAGAVTYQPGGRGFLARTGLALGAGRAQEPIGSGFTNVERGGGGFIVAVGYEFRPGDRFGFGPELQYGYMNLRDGISGDTINLTFTFNWYL
jgi:hypothetical protein